MLVLSRKTQQQIHIGEGITVTILRIQGNTVRLGIDAPRETRVLRGELRDQCSNDDQGPTASIEVSLEPAIPTVAIDDDDRPSDDAVAAIPFGMDDRRQARLNSIRSRLAGVGR